MPSTVIAEVLLPGEKVPALLTRSGTPKPRGGKGDGIRWDCSGDGAFRVCQKGQVCEHMQALFNENIDGAQVTVVDSPQRGGGRRK